MKLFYENIFQKDDYSNFLIEKRTLSFFGVRYRKKSQQRRPRKIKNKFFVLYIYLFVYMFTEPALIAKSSIVLDVKPWDDTTDMKQMEIEVRKIKTDGLLWGACK